MQASQSLHSAILNSDRLPIGVGLVSCARSGLNRHIWRVSTVTGAGFILGYDDHRDEDQRNGEIMIDDFGMVAP
jgi:hypothetical protein